MILRHKELGPVHTVIFNFTKKIIYIFCEIKNKIFFILIFFVKCFSFFNLPITSSTSSEAEVDTVLYFFCNFQKKNHKSSLFISLFYQFKCSECLLSHKNRGTLTSHLTVSSRTESISDPG